MHRDHVRALLCLALTGCCMGPDYLSFALVRERTGSNAPVWGSVETIETTDRIEINFPTDARLSADVLELYDAQSTRVAFSGTDRHVPTNDEACDHNERHYLLDSLAPGPYQLVHRRKRGTGDPLNCLDPDCPWTTFDGDEAVTLTLVVE